MENQAKLGITIDANGAIRTTDQLSRSLDQLGVSSVAATRNMGAITALHAEAVGKIGAHSFAYGRLENALGSFVGHAMGVPPVLEKISVAMGKFSVGSIEITAILLGISAIVAGYDAITEGARKAREEQEKLTKALADRFKPKTGTGSDVLAEYDAALAAQKSARGRLRDLQTGGPLQDIEVSLGYSRQHAIDNATEDLRQANLALGRARANGAGILPNVTVDARNMDALGRRQNAQTIQYNELMARTYGSWGSGSPLQGTGSLFDQVGWANSQASPSLVQAAQGLQINPYAPVSMPNVGITDGLTKEQIKMREKMGIFIDDANKNAEKLSASMWGSALQGASIIVSALNIGGGGRGSGIGGALGGVLGAGLTHGAGMLTSGLWGIAGTVIGSLVGGLFDHKKSEEQIWQDQLNEQKRHTAWLQKNNQLLGDIASTINAPSGYKVAGARYRADDGRQLYLAVSLEASARQRRGGVAGMGLAS